MPSVLLYIAALALLAIHPLAPAAALASSPSGVAHGQLVQLLSSGLIVDGPALPQIAALAVLMIAAARRIAGARIWAAAVSAHVGATLVAYALVGLLWLLDRGLVAPVLRAPDYGVSVVFVSVLGVMIARARPGLVAPITVGLTAIWLLWWWLAGAFTPLVLANLEHLLGFVVGARMGCAARLGSAPRVTALRATAPRVTAPRVTAPRPEGAPRVSGDAQWAAGSATSNGGVP